MSLSLQAYAHAKRTRAKIQSQEILLCNKYNDATRRTRTAISGNAIPRDSETRCDLANLFDE
jgi:hypothetical protein